MNSARSGFSLIEIMIVVGIIGLIMAIAVPGFMGARKKANITATKAMLQKLEGNIEQFKDDTGQYPNTLHDLYAKPFDEKVAKRWEGPYVKKDVFEDAFGSDIQYQVTKGQKQPYELYSYGPNKEGSPSDEWINASDL